MLMVVMVAREKWTDGRLDALDNKVDDGLERLNSDIKDLRWEMNARFDKVDARFDRVDARFDKIDERFNRIGDRMVRAAWALAAATIGGATAIIAALIAANG
ncbi:MAG TPA: hypothetical protein VFK14_11955 [Solirubrobacterales bacterium]|nr:hypothetical protein [Solirubrobacterales bacterium]